MFMEFGSNFGTEALSLYISLYNLFSLHQNITNVFL